MRGVPGNLKHNRSKKEQEIQDYKDATLDEMLNYIEENNLTYSQVWAYAKENVKQDWLDVLWSRQRRNIIKGVTIQRNYEVAKKRNKEFYQWCKDNNFTVQEGLNKAKDIPEFSKICSSPAAINLLCDLERAEQSKKVKEGKPNTRKPKKVRCLEDGLVFPSINKTAEYYGIKRTHDISDCCYGVIGSVKGLHFEFVNQEDK